MKRFACLLSFVICLGASAHAACPAGQISIQGTVTYAAGVPNTTNIDCIFLDANDQEAFPDNFGSYYAVTTSYAYDCAAYPVPPDVPAPATKVLCQSFVDGGSSEGRFSSITVPIEDGAMLQLDILVGAVTTTTSTTSTTTTTGGTATTTTLPPSCDAGCDDGDACTDDACVDATCRNVRRSGVAGVACLCSAATPAACAADGVPGKVTTARARACTALQTASGEVPARRLRRLLRTAIKNSRVGKGAATKAGARERISADCASALSTSLGALQSGAQSLLNP